MQHFENKKPYLPINAILGKLTNDAIVPVSIRGWTQLPRTIKVIHFHFHPPVLLKYKGKIHP